MADESTQEQAAPVADAAKESSPAETDQKETSAPSGKNERGKRRDETPIEELFDLSKPIKRVERPSKPAHEDELATIDSAIESLKEDRRKVQAKIDSAMDSSKNSALGREREALSQLRAKKGALIDQKKAIRQRLDAVRDRADRLVKDAKDAKSAVRYTNLADIDREIAKLQRRQETTSMSLSDEKRLIKEMDALQASKKYIAQIQSKETDLGDVKDQRKAISAELSGKDKEIDALQKEIDEKSAALKAKSDKQTDQREVMQALFAERDEIKKKMDDKHKEKNACRQAFREANNEWYSVQRAIRAQKQMQYEEEKKKREEERQAWLKKKEEEELKKTPYEEEMALCDYLADYLTTTYLTDAKDEKQKQLEEQEKKKQADVVAVKDDPFAGMKAMNKKGEDEYFGKGKGKKKRARGPKKAKQTTFTLNVDSFEQFGLLNLSPPTSLDMVEASVAELKEKKKWYSEQPRGSVPTAQDIRKANERAAAKIRQSGESNGDSGAVRSKDTGAGSSKKKGGTSAFSLSSDDFVPLGGASAAASSSLNSSWGQKAAEESAPEATGEAAEVAEATEEISA